ncbi:MAG: hypothetical protein V4691_09535 [Pseudomonadota bacterium]
MKFTTSLLVAAVALTPAIAFAKTKTAEPVAMTKTSMTTGSLHQPVNVNSATEEELVALFSKKEHPEHAKTDATAVIGARPYAKVEDVKKVIPKLYASVKTHLTAQ